MEMEDFELHPREERARKLSADSAYYFSISQAREIVNEIRNEAFDEAAALVSGMGCDDEFRRAKDRILGLKVQVVWI